MTDFDEVCANYAARCQAADARSINSQRPRFTDYESVLSGMEREASDLLMRKLKKRLEVQAGLIVLCNDLIGKRDTEAGKAALLELRAEIQEEHDRILDQIAARRDALNCNQERTNQ